ncbi:MAG: NAD-dependent epimerase/dehydratase family protein, partial [Bacteroidia bacterium]
IGDVAPHIANSVNVKEAYNQVFNIGADQNYSVNELATTVMKAIGIKGELRHLEARNEVLHAHADHAKAHKIFNIKSYTSLENGLTKMTEWAKVAGVRKSAKFSNIEIIEKLPPVWLED